MSQPPTNGVNLLDPWGFWKTARDANLEAWSKLMIDIVNSDEYAQATGVALEQALATSQPVRDAIEKSMTQTLSLLNMPSRAEVISVAERMVNVEMRLDDMDAKLTTMQNALQETIKETIRQAMSTQNRHIRDLEEKVEAADAKYAALEETVKDAVKQAMVTPGRHIREIETHLEEVDSKISALQAPASPTVKAEVKPEAKAPANGKPEPETKAPPKAEAKPAQPTAAKKEQEAK